MLKGFLRICEVLRVFHAGEAVDVKTFAKRWGVSEKTVRRTVTMSKAVATRLAEADITLSFRS
jgi:hypothetical protein